MKIRWTIIIAASVAAYFVDVVVYVLYANFIKGLYGFPFYYSGFSEGSYLLHTWLSSNARATIPYLRFWTVVLAMALLAFEILRIIMVKEVKRKDEL